MNIVRQPYDLRQSPLFRLRSKEKLAAHLQVSRTAVVKLNSFGGSYKEWTTEPKFPGSKNPALLHKPRDIQEPFGLLRVVQKRLTKLLSRTTLPDYLHSARKGRSYRSNAIAHLGPGGALRIDIKKFYQNVSDKYVLRFFRNDLECSEDIAHILTEIACFRRHLPTGSSLSPIISFLAYRRMFDELNEIAQANGAAMTVYVDDVVMSGVRRIGVLVPLCKRVLKNYELKGHKVSVYGNGETRVITGVAVGPDGLGIPYKRRRKIRALAIELNRSTNAVEKVRYKNALVGQLREGSALDPSFLRLAADIARIEI